MKSTPKQPRKSASDLGSSSQTSHARASATGPFVGGPKQPDDPHVLAVAARVYEMYVDNMSISKISIELKISRDTASRLLKEEGERRKHIESETRAADREARIRNMRRVEQFYLSRMNSSEAKGDEGSRALEASEKMAKLMGVYHSETSVVEHVVSNKFEGFAPDQIFTVLQKLPDGGAFSQHG